VPAFVEELCRYVLDTGNDSVVATPATGIPVTLRDSLMARLDRTGEAKQVAQLAATIGRWFSERLIEAVAGLPPERLQRDLAQLVAAQVLTRDGEPPDVVYRFRHALMQELAYDSLLKRTRARYHAEIAATIEAGFVELASRRPELLAHHFEAAGDSRKAAVYFERARRSAEARSSTAEASVQPHAAGRSSNDVRDEAS
jgi:predicted ATPase